MNGPIAQAVALVCHGNAVLRSMRSQPFWPTNSTAQFCDRIAFVRYERKLLGDGREQTVAPTPDEWFLQLRQDGKRLLNLSRGPGADTRIGDRMSAGFIGGGGTWIIEAVGPDDKAHRWAASWAIWNQNAPDRRVWRVDYEMVGEGQWARPRAHLVDCQRELIDSLEEVLSFAVKENLDGFADRFVRALDCLKTEGRGRSGYHKDLAPEGALSTSATETLDACQSAWVFGGMGSWNDLVFQGAIQQRYDEVSERLFTAVNAAIIAAANSSAATPA